MPRYTTFPAGAATRAAERLYPSSNKYKTSPAIWVKEIVNEYVWHMQRVILEAMIDNKYIAVKACHSAGKSHIISRAIGWWLDPRVHSLGNAFAVTTAPSWPQVEAILWRYLRQLHNKAQLPGRITLDCQWHMSARGAKFKVGDPSEELIAFGRKPADYDQGSLQGIHAMYVLGVIDEANGVPKQLFDAMSAITTNDFSRVIAIGNPDDPSSHFAEVCKPGSGWKVIQIPAWITPNITTEFAKEYGKGHLRKELGIPEEDPPDDVRAVLLGQNWIEERERDWGVGSPLWMSRVEAEFPEVTDDTLISPSMMRKAYAKEQSGLELGQYGLDIARMGEDRSVMYRNRGFHIRLHRTWAKMDTEESAAIASEELDKHGPNRLRIPISVDAIGVGAGVFDKLKHRGYNVRAIYGSEKARNEKKFKNRRAEMYWTLRELMDEGIIDLDEEDTVLAAQLGSIKWWEDTAGRIVLESKDDMRKRGLPSPDRADAAVLSIVKRGSTKEDKPRIRREPGLTEGLMSRVM